MVSSYVEMLESQQAQLVAGLQELYRRAKNGQGWTGPSLKETSHGTFLTHDILEALGALNQEGCSETFEEDLNTLQQKMVANGASLMHREPSLDTSSESDHTSSFDSMSQKRPKFTDPFSASHLPPTPPYQSPYPQMTSMTQSMKPHEYPQHLAAATVLQYATPLPMFDDSMDFINKYDSPMAESGMDTPAFSGPMFPNQMSTMAINPCLTMKDWTEQEEMHRCFNGNFV